MARQFVLQTIIDSEKVPAAGYCCHQLLLLLLLLFYACSAGVKLSMKSDSTQVASSMPATAQVLCVRNVLVCATCSDGIPHVLMMFLMYHKYWWWLGPHVQVSNYECQRPTVLKHHNLEICVRDSFPSFFSSSFSSTSFSSSSFILHTHMPTHVVAAVYVCTLSVQLSLFSQGCFGAIREVLPVPRLSSWWHTCPGV